MGHRRIASPERKRKRIESSSPSESSSSSSSMADKDEKRSSRASKSKAKKKLVVVDDDDDWESSEFEEDVLHTLDDLQPVTYTTKLDKGSFLTRVALKQELRSSFEHGYVVVDYWLKTFKMNLFQKGCRMLTNCVQYFYKRPLKFVMVGTFYSLCIANKENFIHESCANIISHLQHLMPKHKVTILALSFNFLEYERSSAMAVAIVDRFICNFSEYLGIE